MFMPNDFGNGDGAPQQGSGGPFDLQAQLAQLPPQIRAQVMARMGMPGQGGMQANTPDQGVNQFNGGMQPGLPNQGVQGQMPHSGGGGGGFSGSPINPNTGQPWDRNIGPGMRQQILAQSQQPALGSGPIVGGDSRGGQMQPTKLPGMGGRQGVSVPGVGPNMGPGSFGGGNVLTSMPGAVGGQGSSDTGNVLTPMPAQIPNGNARPFSPPRSNREIISQHGGRTSPPAGRPTPGGGQRPGGTGYTPGGGPTPGGGNTPPGQTDPPQIEPTITGTATDVKPLVGKPFPSPSPQQDPLQGTTKPKPRPRPKPTLGRNYGPK